MQHHDSTLCGPPFQELDPSERSDCTSQTVTAEIACVERVEAGRADLECAPLLVDDQVCDAVLCTLRAQPQAAQPLHSRPCKLLNGHLNCGTASSVRGDAYTTCPCLAVRLSRARPPENPIPCCSPVQASSDGSRRSAKCRVQYTSVVDRS